MVGRDFISPRLRSSNECLIYENGASFFSPFASLWPAFSLFCPVTIITALCFLNIRGIPFVAHHPFVLRLFRPFFLTARLPLARLLTDPFLSLAFFSCSRFSPYARFHSRSLCPPQVAAINAKTTRQFRALSFCPVTAPKNPLSR